MGVLPRWLDAQEVGRPRVNHGDIGLEAKRSLERVEKIRGPKKELQISPANVVIRIRPPDADPQVDFS